MGEAWAGEAAVELAPGIGEAGKALVFVRRRDPAVDTEPADTYNQVVAVTSRCAHVGCPVQPGGPVFLKQEKKIETANGEANLEAWSELEMRELDAPRLAALGREIGIPRLENPPGFFTLLYVDQAATLTGSGVELALSAGWNVFTVRFPEERAVYAVGTSVEDIVLDVILP